MMVVILPSIDPFIHYSLFIINYSLLFIIHYSLLFIIHYYSLFIIIHYSLFIIIHYSLFIIIHYSLLFIIHYSLLFIIIHYSLFIIIHYYSLLFIIHYSLLFIIHCYSLSIYSPLFIYFDQLSGCLKIEPKINKTPGSPQDDTWQHGDDDRVDVMVERWTRSAAHEGEGWPSQWSYSHWSARQGAPGYLTTTFLGDAMFSTLLGIINFITIAIILVIIIIIIIIIVASSSSKLTSPPGIPRWADQQIERHWQDREVLHWWCHFQWNLACFRPIREEGAEWQTRALAQVQPCKQRLAEFKSNRPSKQVEVGAQDVHREKEETAGCSQ